MFLFPVQNRYFSVQGKLSPLRGKKIKGEKELVTGK